MAVVLGAFLLMMQSWARGELRQEHEMLDIILESITASHAQHSGPERWLATRAWSGNSHIGIRPLQPQWYYDVTRSLQPHTLCEVGFNGGHSAAVLLAAAGRQAKLHVFDLMAFSYSARALALLRALFPDQVLMHTGDSSNTVPQFHRVWAVDPATSSLLMVTILITVPRETSKMRSRQQLWVASSYLMT